jgi:uncharacterized protein (TIGR02284 family)
MTGPAAGDAIPILEDLYATCRDGEDGFRLAAAELADPDLRERFIRHAHRRAGLASELVAELQQAGGEPPAGGHVTGAIHRGWMRLKGALTGQDDAAILSEAERGEDVAVETYRAALGRELPPDLRPVLERQLGDIEAAHADIRALRDRVGGSREE